MSQERGANRRDLIRIAGEVMAERGLEPEFPAAVQAQLATITGPGRDEDPHIRDHTALPWCSIDNDDSLDLDQLTACEPLAAGAVKIFVAVADVDALVPKGSAIDAHAWTNTTSVYTSAWVFAMLPERLSTDSTSLSADQDRLAEDASQKVERRMRESEAALLLESRVGQSYHAIVTGSSESGLWVRIFAPPAEGRLESGPRGLELGQKIRVKLVSTDVARGFIDCVAVG